MIRSACRLLGIDSPVKMYSSFRNLAFAAGGHQGAAGGGGAFAILLANCCALIAIAHASCPNVAPHFTHFPTRRSLSVYRVWCGRRWVEAGASHRDSTSVAGLPGCRSPNAPATTAGPHTRPPPRPPRPPGPAGVGSALARRLAAAPSHPVPAGAAPPQAGAAQQAAPHMHVVLSDHDRGALEDLVPSTRGEGALLEAAPADAAHPQAVRPRPKQPRAGSHGGGRARGAVCCFCPGASLPSGGGTAATW